MLLPFAFPSKTPATGFYPHLIDNSLRFDGSNSYMYYVPSTSTNRTQWTFSAWVKRAKLGVRQYVVIAWDWDSTVPTNDQTRLNFEANDTIELRRLSEGTYWERRYTTRVFRDTSAWYHIVWALDAQNPTQALRSRLYINGEEIPYSDFTVTNAPSATGSSYFCTAGVQTNLGAAADNQPGSQATSPAGVFDGYIADAQLIDGSVLDPTSFGQLKSGIWIPKAYSGSYGTNGFHLDFADNTSATTLGYDVSGNSNNFTPSGIATSDQMLDSPTNNFCTFNELAKATDHVNSEGNLKTATTSTSTGMTKSTVVMSTARETTNKWYAEFYYQANSDNRNVALIGIAETGTDPAPSAVNATSYVYYAYTGVFFDAGANTVYSVSYAVGDIIGVSFDEATGELEFFKNGDSKGVAKTGLSGDFVFCVADASSGRSVTIVANFGQDSSFSGAKTRQNNTDANGYGDFYYTPPTGHLALCTQNLPDPTFDPRVGASPQDHFSVDLDADGSGALTAAQAVFPTGIWWLKDRTLGSDHLLVDSARGSTLEINPNSTAIESTYSDPSNSSVSWSWKAATSVSGTTTGSGTLKPYSGYVNAAAGVSVIEYEGNATAGHQIPHHLASAPNVVIVKNRDYNLGNWMVFHSHIDASPETCNILLNATSAKTASVATWNSTLPSSSAISLGNGPDENRDTDGHVAYSFAEKAGFSKFGVYSGNYNVDGPFVYLGFRPAFVMIKATGGTTGKWAIFDSARDGYNVENDAMHVYPVGAEDTTDQLDLLSNGFKVRVQLGDLNNSAYEYIYMAFAEQPFKFSNAR